MNVIGRWIFMALFGMLAMQAHAQYYGAGQTFVCKSSGYNQNYCQADTRGGVTMVRQLSDSACVQGRSWGYDSRGVWVTQGCKAEFVIGERYSGGGNDVIRCESSDYRQQYCRVDTRGGVRIARQLSNTACIRGQNWDYDRGGVWVNNGCKADFSIVSYVDQGYGPGYESGDGNGRLVRCESIGNRLARCQVDTRGGVRLVRKLSGSSCDQSRSWDWDRNGIWVTAGCRAEFQVGGVYRDQGYYDDRR